MRVRHAWIVLFIGLCSFGCSSADSSASSGGRGAGFTGAGTRAGSGQPTMGGAAGSFGNTGATAGPTSGMMAAAPVCTQGMRCYTNKEADTSDCGHQTLESSVKTIENPGNILLVYDTSGSMDQDWNGMPKWQAAGTAIQNALMPLKDMLTVGTVFFPRNDPSSCVDPTGIACVFVPGLGCGVTPITSADQINFTPGPQFLTTFTGSGGTPLYAPLTGGLTPLSEGLKQAQSALSSSTLSGITAVIIITDGDPNCAWDQAGSTQIVTDWAAVGIKTYVLGVPGVGSMGEMLLNSLASAGGTGMYIPPSDPMALQMKLNEIVSSTITQGIDSCSIALNPPAEVPDKLHLVVTQNGQDQDVARMLSKDASWSITPDGATVTLEGLLCDQAKAGAYEKLRFDFGCVDLPPLPPPMGPD